MGNLRRTILFLRSKLLFSKLLVRAQKKNLRRSRQEDISDERRCYSLVLHLRRSLVFCLRQQSQSRLLCSRRHLPGSTEVRIAVEKYRLGSRHFGDMATIDFDEMLSRLNEQRASNDPDTRECVISLDVAQREK